MSKITIKGIEVEYDYMNLTYENSKALDKNIAKDNLFKFKNIMDENNVDIILMYGTLLGAVREKDFIEHDIDIDLICFSEIELIKSINNLIISGFKFVRYEKESKTYSFIRNDCYIDVYIVSHVKGLLGLFYYNLCGKLYPKGLLKSFKYIDFIGGSFLAPKKIEDNLVYCYGDDWRTPIANKPGVHESKWQIKIKKVISKFLPKNILTFIINYYKNSLDKN